MKLKIKTIILTASLIILVAVMFAGIWFLATRNAESLRLMPFAWRTTKTSLAVGTPTKSAAAQAIPSPVVSNPVIQPPAVVEPLRKIAVPPPGYDNVSQWTDTIHPNQIVTYDFRPGWVISESFDPERMQGSINGLTLGASPTSVGHCSGIMMWLKSQNNGPQQITFIMTKIRY